MAADLTRFCCLNPDCPDHGKRDHGNIAVRAGYGPRQTRLLYCKSCKQRFSERQGTPLFDSRLPPEQAHAVLAHLHTVMRFARRHGAHASDAHDELVALSPPDDPSAGG
jgi:hypothetical protein